MDGFIFPIRVVNIHYQCSIHIIIPFKALKIAKMILKLVKIKVDLETQLSIVKGLNRYRAATVEGEIDVFSILNFGSGCCCLMVVIIDKA